MGLLVDGEWRDRWYDTESTGGEFQRKESSFRGEVTAPVRPGRYHLYVSYACPWAHRTLIVRALKGLEDTVGVSVVHPLMLEHGWEFHRGYADHVNGKRYLHEVYTAAQSDYTGRVTVPVLWDTEAGTIVNNESAEIIRMLNRAFGGSGPDLSPEAHLPEIDDVNARVYDHVNNGVYKAGFATRQQAYEKAVRALFDTLDWLEERLDGRDWLVGDAITETDIRLFTTLIRFDPVYFGHFKCNLRRLVDYPNLWRHTRRIYHLPGVADTVHMDHIQGHYYGSHKTINPTQIVPLGPIIDYSL